MGAFDAAAIGIGPESGCGFALKLPPLQGHCDTRQANDAGKLVCACKWVMSTTDKLLVLQGLGKFREIGKTKNISLFCNLINKIISQ